MSAIITPIIHMNGDRKETLITNLEHAYTALHEASIALCQCAPNGRNFYPAPGRMALAETQYYERQAHIKAVMDSLVAEVEKIELDTQR